MAHLSGEKTEAKSMSRSDVDRIVGVPPTVFNTLQLEAMLEGTSATIHELAQAAGLALEITTIVETMKRNKAGFQSLADDSRNLVYVFVCVNRYANDVPPELEKQLLKGAVTVLLEVKAFAQKASSRTMNFSAFIQAEAEQIQHYRRELEQCLTIFGTGISPEDMVYKMLGNIFTLPRGTFLKALKNKDRVEPNGESKGSSPDPNPTPGPGLGAKPASGFDFSGAGGSPNRWAGVKINRGGHTATNDYSVKGENVNVVWASGTDFRSNYVGRSS